ncbi:trifunctional serine/threonine-protein kinase/ATP-binding protein/sensor histidine kinase [Polyangium jinanense]|nr:AAA family ATPase [Polyangium jinanense]
MGMMSGYEPSDLVHEGSHCCIYLAHREVDGMPVVLKVLKAEHPSPEEIAWFRREYELLAQVSSPFVVRTHALLEAPDGRHAIVLEDFGGQSLDRLIPAHPWSLAEQLAVAIAATDALAALHQRSIVHKDVSPANLVYNPQTQVCKLIDLGISTILSRERAVVLSPEALEGTLRYISPEQTGRMNRMLDYRTDFYSLGATLYELFTGTPPFSSDDPMELVHCHLARVPIAPCKRNTSIAKPLSDVLMRLLSKTPEARYQSTYGIQADLRACAEMLAAKSTIDVFPLGQHDVPEQFQVPQKLYGREKELATLLGVFDRVTEGKSAALALVTGYSGVGKSALVHELHKPITRQRGYFIEGKFDQFLRTTPYSALVSAFRSLVRQILGESEDVLAALREQLVAALGPNGRIITDVIPEVELVVGPQPEVAELGPTEAQNRFNLAIRSFIRVFAQPSHPLVLLLDDLQWADSGSLKLIDLILRDVEPQCLLVIGAYRDHEVGPAHPLRMMLGALEADGVPIDRIPLLPLGIEDVQALIADAVGRSPADVEPLARLVARKTEGNPLFVGELLKTIYQEGLIAFDRAAGRWTWDVARIEAQGITDSVVDLMIGKLRRLPEVSRRAIEVASCMGGVFELKPLAVVLEISEPEAYERLLPALQEGFVVALSGLVLAQPDVAGSPFVIREYRFIHDRVQQAAYALLGENEREGVHVRIGRHLIVSGHDAGERLFDVVDQLNRGRRLITDEHGLRELCRLNLDAGLRAKRATAYAAASAYLEAGLAALPETNTDRDAPLPLSLHKELAAVSALIGNYERSEALIRHVLKHAPTDIEKAESYEMLVRKDTMLARYDEAMNAAKDGLAILGVDLPIHLPPEGIQAAMGAEIAEVQASLAVRSLGSLRDAPPMTDPAARAAMGLLTTVLAPAFFVSPLLYALIIVKAVNISLKFGPAPESSDIYAYYGHITSSILGDRRLGRELALLALSLSDRFRAPDDKCRSSFLLANFISPWVRHLRESLPVNDAGYQAGLEGGELQYAGYILIYKLFNRFYEGAALDPIAQDLPGFLKLTQQTKNEIASDIIVGLRLALENLLGNTPSRTDFSAEGLDDAAYLAACEAHKSSMALAFYPTLKAEVLYLHDEPARALEVATRSEPLLAAIIGNVAVAHHHLYHALSLAAVIPDAPEADRAGLRETLGALAADFVRWAETGPDNFAHLSALVSAEVQRVDGRISEALDLYEQAIEGARRGNFLQHTALAYELAGKAWFARGRDSIAQAYLREAYRAYQLRGARRKLGLLRERYSPSLTPRDISERRSGPPSGPSSTTSRTAGDRLDLGSVIKASLAISSEIVLEKLLTTLMHVVIENAGAQRGALVLEKKGRLVVEVDATVAATGEVVGVLRSTPIEEYPNASEEIVRYVARTRETVILDDAARAGAFTRSPYVASHAPKSMLVAPLLHQGKPLGIIYLENHLTTGAFTKERLEMLRLLSSQIAISLENAQLYREMEQRVLERTEELRKKNINLQQAIEDLKTTQAQLVQSEKMASLGRLTVGIAHEIKNPLNFVNNFAQINAELVQEIEESAASGATFDEVSDILADVRANSEKIASHGKRADDIVRSMMQHASGATGVRQPTDINALVEDYVKLSYHGSRGENPVHIERDYDPSVGLVEIVAQDFGRVIVNLLNNALYALGEKQQRSDSRYVPTIHVSSRRQGKMVEVSIRDNGTGIPVSVRDRIFEPFFTSKPGNVGTGLGLSLSYDIVVNGHGGSITFDSVEGDYAAFRVSLPG